MQQWAERCMVPQPDASDSLRQSSSMLHLGWVLRGVFLQLSLTSDLTMDVARKKKRNFSLGTVV